MRSGARAPAAAGPPLIEPPEPVEVFEFEGWRLCPSRFELRSPDGALVPLSTTEVKVLAAMVRQPGRVFTRDWLREMGGGPDGAVRDSALDCRMSRLRRRLRRACSDAGDLIRAVRQEGYVFAGPVRRYATV